MSKKYNRADAIRRITFHKVETKQILLKYFLIQFRVHRLSSLICDNRIFILSAFFCLEFRKFLSVIFFVRVHNRCVLTGRGRGVYRYFKLSRMFVKKLISYGFFIGVRKASW